MAVCTIAASAPTRYIGCFSGQNDTITTSSPFKLPLFWPWQKVQKVKVGPLSISPMGFGTWAWGNQLLWGYEESMDNELQQVFNLAVDNGINLFDTADSYGTGRLNGQSEKLLGKFIREYRGKKRVQDDIVIATKFAAYPWRLTPRQFVEACKSSLERLQLEQIGIGQLHWSTANYAPLQERALWDGLVAMYEKGLVRAVGVSNYGPKQLVKIHNYLKDRGVPLCTAQVYRFVGVQRPLKYSDGVICLQLLILEMRKYISSILPISAWTLMRERLVTNLQVQFSLLSYGDEQMEIMNVCNSLDVQLIAYSPLGLGMLTGKYTPSNLPKGPRGLLFRQILPGLEPLLTCLRDIARRRQKTMSQVAINWCISEGTIPIPGVKTVQQVQDNLGALGWRLSADELIELEDAARQSPRKMIQNIFQTR